MKAVILAGGFGTRLKSVIADIPKPMAPVNGHPFLEILVKRLVRRGITDIVLSVGYKQEVVSDYFGNGSSIGATINYSPEDFPLGTGGAIHKVMVQYPDDLYLVMNGDSFFDNNIPELLAYHHAKQANITLALTEVTDKGRYGSVDLSPDGVICGFAEKGGSGLGLINAGVYVLEHRCKDYFLEKVCSFENDILPEMIGKGLFGIHQQGAFIDIGIPEDYHAFCQLRPHIKEQANE